LACSGKTTLARELEAQYSALRLTADEWHIRLFGHDFGDNMTHAAEAEHDSRHQSVEFVMWNVAARVLVLGIDVILDFGCWARSERDEFRTKARNLGADFKIHFADAPKEVLVERLKTRNAQRAEGTFFIPESKLREWIRMFEPPTSEELDSSED
jgi:predicted kinase